MKKILLLPVLLTAVFVLVPLDALAQASSCSAVVHDKGLATTQSLFSTESIAYGWGAYNPGNPFFYPPERWFGSVSLARQYDIPFEIVGGGLRPMNVDSNGYYVSSGSCNAVCEQYDSDFCLWTADTMSFKPASDPGLFNGCTAFKMKPNYQKSRITHPDSPLMIGIPGGDGIGIPMYNQGGNSYSVCTPNQDETRPTASLIASPNSLEFGMSSSLQYRCTNSTNATITAHGVSIGALSSPNSGSKTVTPPASTTYTLTCTGAGGSATAQARVNVYSLSNGINLTTSGTAATSGEPIMSGGPISVPIAYRVGAGESHTYQATVMDSGNSGVRVAPGLVSEMEVMNGASPAATHTTSVAFNEGGYNTTSVSFTYTFPSEGTYYVRTCADTTNRIAEQIEADNCGEWSEIQVGPPAVNGPDLTAGTPTAPGARSGATVTISAPILNIGNVLAGASQAYYQLTAPSAKQSVSGVVSMTAISATSSLPASFSYRFPSSGNYSVRFCADWWGEVAEADETNNCGPWAEIALPEVPIANSVSCQVSSQSVTVGQSVQYTALPNGAATNPFTWTPSDGVGSYGTNQTAIRTFTEEGSYGMQVSAQYASNPGNCPVVTVGAGYCSTGTPELTIEATPNRVRAGSSVQVQWSAENVLGQNATCTVTGPGVNWSQAVSPAPACAVSGSATPTITTQSTYILQCGSARASVVVNVIPEFEEF